MDNLLTAPFRDAGKGATTVFESIKRGLTGEGFAPIEIKGHKFKLDIINAYALEDGRAMDRIVKIIENERSKRLEEVKQEIQQKEWRKRVR